MLDALRRAVLGATIAVALLVGLPAPAGAHEERSLHALTVIDSVTPPADGLEIRVVHLGAPALAIENSSGRTLEVTGEDGEPFLRIGPAGVSFNARSETTYRSIDPNGDAVPDGLAAGAARWVSVSDTLAWTWFDPRLVFGGSSAWSIPMELGGSPVEIRGSFEPLDGHGHFVTELDAPEVSGLDIRLLPGPVPALFLRNDTAKVIEVAGPGGEPFLRIGPRGVVANLRSPSYYNGGSLAIRPVPRGAGATAVPRWKKVSDEPVWGWLEYGAALDARTYERDLLGSRRRAVHSWTSHLRWGDGPLELKGRIVWVPPSADHPASTSEPSPLLGIALSLASLGGIAWLVLRFGRREVTPA